MTEEIQIRFSDRYDVKEKLRKQKFDDFSNFELTLLSYQILSQLNNEQLSILSSLKSNQNLSVFDHQILAAQKVKGKLGGNALLADEVGLGKTIEAGIILKEFLMTGLIKNALILTPPSLVNQWKEELLNKFNIDFISQYDTDRFVDCSQHELLILSHASAIQEKNSALLNERYWDMIIVDEAHSMKNAETHKHQLVKNLTKRYLLLLTATPIQNNLLELYNMIEILKPGLLGTWNEFKTKYILDKNIRKINPLRKDELQQLLSQIIIRTTRNEVRKYIQFTDRIPKTKILIPSNIEIQLYEKITEIIRNMFDENQNLLPLMIYQRLISSSTASTLIALYKIKQNGKITNDEYDKLVRLSKSIPIDSKMNELLKIIQNDKDSKFLIFTEFYATQDYIASELQKKGYLVSLFNGKMSNEEKLISIKDFKTKSQFLVSTGAGGEGQNFQFCHNIVNYDLPWNPMRVEQRVGRVHRIGQKMNVNIYNLALNGTIEAYILELLYMKIHLFTMTLGELDLLFEDITDENEQGGWFKEYLASKSPDDIKNRFSAIGDSWKKRKETLDNAINEFNLEVFGNFDLSSLKKNE